MQVAIGHELEDEHALVVLVAEGQEADDVGLADAEQGVQLLVAEGAAEALAAAAVDLDGGELGLGAAEEARARGRRC